MINLNRFVMLMWFLFAAAQDSGRQVHGQDGLQPDVAHGQDVRAHASQVSDELTEQSRGTATIIWPYRN
jgi:hypothetical protein